MGVDFATDTGQRSRHYTSIENGSFFSWNFVPCIEHDVAESLESKVKSFCQ